MARVGEFLSRPCSPSPSPSPKTNPSGVARTNSVVVGEWVPSRAEGGMQVCTAATQGRRRRSVHIACVSCVAQGLHLHQLCIASDRVGRESATATATATAKAKEGEDRSEVGGRNEEKVYSAPESLESRQSSAEFLVAPWSSWKPVVMPRGLGCAGCLLLMLCGNLGSSGHAG